MKLTLAVAAAAAVLSVSTAANAVVVDALVHSSDSGAGTGLSTVALTAGQFFATSANLDDLWSAGALPRWSNADGLTGDRFATGTDESGEAAGALIGQDFGLLNINGFSAPYGALVGQIGAGPTSYRLLGTNFSGNAWATGTLVLYYWDTFTADNSEDINVTIRTDAIPEPSTWALMIGGFALAGAALRRRRATAAA